MASVSDNFTRADSSSLGANWTSIGDNGGSIVSNQLTLTTVAQSSASMWNAGGISSADHSSKVTVAAWNLTADYQLLTVYARATAGNNNYRCEVDSDGDWWLSKNIVGSVTDMASGAGLSLNAGDTLEIRCLGTAISAYFNGVLLASTTDADIATGAPGFKLRKDTGSAPNITISLWGADDQVSVYSPPIYGQLGYGPLGSGAVGLAWAGAQVPAGGAYTLTAAQGSYSLTGQAAILKRSRILAAAQGSYALTGQAAILKRGRLVTAAQGSYSLTGQIALIFRGRVVTAAQGSYSLTGQAATITYTPAAGAYVLTANQGTYTLTGQAASITRSRLLTAAQGSYALTGQAAAITRSRLLTAAQGGYTLTGQAAAITRSRILAAAQGSYAVNGQAAILKRGRLLTANQGTYSLTGQAATITYTPAAGAYVLTAAAGVYVINGQASTITYSGGAAAGGELELWRRRRRPAAHTRG